MSQATHVYRNQRNGKVGEMTEEQAAIWPDLLLEVEDDAKPLGYVPLVVTDPADPASGDATGESSSSNTKNKKD